MPQQYFDALYKDKPWVLDFIKKAQEKNLKPIRDYLEIVIREQEKRQVSTSWEPVITNTYVIEPQFRILKLSTERNVTIDLSKYYIIKGIDENIKEGKHRLIDDDIFVNIVCSYRDVDSQYLILSNVLSQNTVNLTWKDQFQKSKFLEVEIEPFNDIRFVEIDNQAITKFIIKDSKLEFLTPSNNQIPQQVCINNLIYTNQFQVSYTSNSTLFHNGKQLEIIKRREDIIYINDTSSIDSIVDQHGNQVTFEPVKESIPKSFFYNDDIYEFRLGHNNTYELVSHENINAEILLNDQLAYKISKSNQTNPYTITIRLLEEKKDDDDPSAHIKSRLDYFFEENVSELSSEPRPNQETTRFELVYGKKENRTLVLRSQERNKKITYEDLPKKLFLVYDTSQNKKQKFAIQELLDRPIPEHRKLLLLNEKLDKTKTDWTIFVPKPVKEWFVLTDEYRDGNKTQRSFVEKALSTPDFAFLEGPPGSGKTTAILELILQLLKDGKRVLLSASTHVAIDNVLERIFQYRNQIHIQAIRIGKDSNIYNYTIKKFTLTNLIDDSIENEYLDVFLQSCNLVCGTSIGILQHPHLKYDRNNAHAPVEAEFDYLIIDESSKTTYQEFLVTAIRAKRWILVGDIKQLPPYAEDFDLIQNFNSLMSTEGNANLLLGYLVMQRDFHPDFRVCIVLTKSDLKYLVDEVISRKSADDNFDKRWRYSFINVHSTDSYIGSRTIHLNLKDSYTYFCQFEHQILLIEEDELIENIDMIPSQYHIIKTNNVTLPIEILNAHSYRKEIYLQNTELNDIVTDQIDRMSDVLSKTWAEHIVWQLKRNFELRFVNGNERHNIEPFIPKRNKESFFQRYELLYQIALPSILESLQKGIKLGRDYILKNPTILNQGFPKEILKPRHEILEFQHRMHPEISAYPRTLFYDMNALKDSSFILTRKDWKYLPYEKNSIWLNVTTRIKENRNYNPEEVSVMINELKHFLDWSKRNPSYKNDGTIRIYEVACLTFYKAQERLIREELKKLLNPSNSGENFFRFKEHHATVSLQTVDKFQGREADITYISMVRRKQQITPGFLDSPNRINVAMTRARYLRVIIGDYEFFKNSRSEALKKLALSTSRRDIK